MTISRFFAFAVALAMLLAPLAMVGTGSAHAMPMAASPTMDHCAGHSDDATHGQPCGTTDCVASCTTIAAAFQTFADFTPAPAARPNAAAVPARLGRGPEFEPPPPRSS